MRRKPKGPKYRNLTARSGVIYYQRVASGKRIRFSCQTDDWEQAAAVARLYEEKKGIGRIPFQSVEVPTFGEFAERYLEEDLSDFAATTQKDRRSALREDGPLLRFLEHRRLDEIDPPLLREWWSAEIKARNFSTKTGRSYLDVISHMFVCANAGGLELDNPVLTFRALIRRRARTQKGRVEAQPDRNVHPIKSAEELGQLTEQAGALGRTAEVYVLLCLDAGLRSGEALALRWGSIAWGVSDADPRRALLITESKSRGRELGPTKSGRDRTVALSRRLRRALLELYLERGRPDALAFVLQGVDASNFYRREWATICERARVGHRRLKDLRDTFASQLLTAGVQLGYVSQQLGHADVAVTARHYARWCGGDAYREPMKIAEGEVPADFLARLPREEAPQSDPTLRSSVVGVSEIHSVIQ